MKSGPSLILSSLSAGIDSFGPEADQNAARDALNLYNERGFAKRRESYGSIDSGPVWLKPPGVGVAFIDVAGVVTNIPGRTLDASLLATPGTYYYMSAADPFDGFELCDVTPGSTPPTTQKKLKFQYSATGNTWADLPWFLDKTKSYLPNSEAAEPFLRRGKIHWHRPAAWVPRLLSTDLGGLNAYFMRWKWVDEETGNDAAPEAAFAVVTPGILIFDRQPVNGLFPTAVGGRRTIVSAADRRLPREHSGGANLGAIRNFETEALGLRVRRSTGFWGVVTCPTFLAPGGSPATTTSGTASEITDQGRGLNNEGPIDAAGLYLQRRPYGTAFLEAITADGGTLSTSRITSTDARLLNLNEGALEHFILEVETVGSSALSIGNHAIIKAFDQNGSVATIDFERPFSSAPAADTTFKILRPPQVVYVDEADMEYHLGALSASAARLVPENTSWRRALSKLGSGVRINFELRDEFRFSVAAGKRWSATYDEVTQELILINGGRPFSFNGRSVVELEAADQDSPILQNLLGQVAKIGPEGFGLVAGVDYRQQFRKQPPSGNIVINYGGRLVIADDRTIKWSLPHVANNIWPLTYEAIVRDQKGGRITTLAVLYDRLIVGTKTGIFEGTLIEGAGINLRPVCSGVGFVSHAAVANIALGQQDVLIGPSADGLIIYAANEPIYAIDSWDRVIDGGISEFSLDDAVGAAVRQRGLYFMAFSPKTGGDLGNTRILVYDYVRKAAWIWSAPWGVSSLATAIGAGGREYLLIGTEDGFIQTLFDGDEDDGQEAINWFAETNDLAPFGTRRADFKRIILTATAQPASKPISVSLIQSDSRRLWLRDAEIPFDNGQAEWNVTEWDDAVWPEGGDKTMPAPVPWGAQATSMRVKIAGTARIEIKSLEVEAAAMSRSKR